MKKYRLIIAIALLSVLILTLAGCSMVQSTLEVPANLKVDGSVAKWNSVDGASKYTIMIDDEEHTTSATYYDLSKLELIEGKSYQIKVKAVGDGYIKLSSDYSESVSFIFERTEGNNSGNSSNIGDASEEGNEKVIEEEGSYSQFTNINIESSYLGYGYDVINDPYMDGDKVDIIYPIIDPEKLESAKLKIAKNLNNTTLEIQEQSMEEITKAYSAKLQLSAKFGTYFSGSLQASFDGSSSEKSFWYFYMNSYTVKNYNIYLTNTISEIKEMLSENFVDDLINMDAEELFDRYGTHMIRSAAMGGRMDICSTYSAVDTALSKSIKAEIEAEIGVLKSLNLGLGGSYSDKVTNSKVNQKISIYQVGGKNIDIGSIQAVAQNRASWYESFNDSMENATLCGVVNDSSLLGIWELLPTGYTERASELKSKFAELNLNKYNELCAGYKLDGVDYSWDNINVTMARYNCNDGNNYNKNEQEESADWRSRHNGFEVGQLVLSGCERVNNTYKIKSFDELSIKYNIIQNIDNLPLVGTSALTKLQEDSANKVLDTGINETIGKGAYWVRVTYTDNSQYEKTAVNFMNGKSSGSYVDLINVNNLSNGKSIKSIDVVVVYEMYSGGPGFLGIWWHEYTNWRCEYRFDFA